MDRRSAVAGTLGRSRCQSRPKPSRHAGTRAGDARERGACCRGTQAAGRAGGRVLGDAGRVLPLAGSVLQARERTGPSTPSQTSPHTRSSVGSGQARHGGRGEGACVPPRRSGRVLWRGHAGTRACRKANLSTSQKSLFARSTVQCESYNRYNMPLRGAGEWCMIQYVLVTCRTVEATAQRLPRLWRATVYRELG